MSKLPEKVKWPILIVAIYFAIGFFYAMTDEIRLAKKYHSSVFMVLSDPYTYLRPVIFSPFWPSDLYWNAYHHGKH